VVQAETGTLEDGAGVYNSLPDAHNDYYVGFNAPGGKVTLNFSLPYAGYYHIYSRSYNTSSNENRREKVQINDNPYSQYIYTPFSMNGDWVNRPISDAYYNQDIGDFEYFPEAGGYYLQTENTIEIETDWNGYSIIDELIFVPVATVHLAEGIEIDTQTNNIIMPSQSSAIDFLENKIELLKGTAAITDKSGNAITPQLIGTGMKLVLSVSDGMTETVVEEYTFVVYGDVDGDGLFSVVDLVGIKKAVVTNDNDLLGGDMLRDGEINAQDIVMLKKTMLGIPLE